MYGEDLTDALKVYERVPESRSDRITMKGLWYDRRWVIRGATHILDVKIIVWL